MENKSAVWPVSLVKASPIVSETPDLFSDSTSIFGYSGCYRNTIYKFHVGRWKIGDSDSTNSHGSIISLLYFSKWRLISMKFCKVATLFAEIQTEQYRPIERTRKSSLKMG